jgi:cob(I)alamin adenosyltransferase
VARIYTRTGDGGETSLFDGSRVRKSAPRVDLYGGVDELNSALGLAVALFAPPPREGGGGAAGLDPAALSAIVQRIQAELLEIGAILADPRRSAAASGAEGGSLPFSTKDLERDIDRLEQDLPKLTAFVLPGGAPAAAAFHVARTVCRRVERRAVELASEEPVPPAIMVYLNRLSDFCFVAARWANRAGGRDDVIWRARS